MMTWVATLAGIAACLGLLLYIFKDQQKLGKIIERETAERKTLDGVAEVNKIRDRINSDPAYLKRVQDRFSRD